MGAHLKSQKMTSLIWSSNTCESQSVMNILVIGFLLSSDLGSVVLNVCLASLLLRYFNCPIRMKCGPVWDFSFSFFFPFFSFIFFFILLINFFLLFQAFSKLATNNANSSAYISGPHEQQVLSAKRKQLVFPIILLVSNHIPALTLLSVLKFHSLYLIIGNTLERQIF